MQSKKIEEIDSNFTVPTKGSERFTYFNIAEEIMKAQKIFYDDTSNLIARNKIIDRFHISGFPWLKSNVSVISEIFTGNSDKNHDNMLYENCKNPDANLGATNKSHKIMKLKELNVTLFNNPFCRLDIYSLIKFNPGIQYLAWCTSGGAIRFASDTGAIALKVKLISKDDMSHMPRTGSAGFDLYVGKGKNKRFIKAAMPGSQRIEYEAVFEGINPNKEMQEWTLYMPLYNGVQELEIGLLPGSRIEKPMPYTIKKPIVFYGSSITQGGCASRPGNSYTSILCRWLDADMVNLGFSGNAKGEPEMAELISKIDMSAFVMDYDHNAPDVKHLQDTHENFFRIIRENNPELPVIFVSRPDFDGNILVSKERRNVIRNTYENALKSGDKNVYFVDGETLFGQCDRDACTVDGCHPNDLGFMRMAENIYPTLKKALKNFI